MKLIAIAAFPVRASALLALAIASGCALPLPDKPVRPAAYDLGAPATAPAAAATTGAPLAFADARQRVQRALTQQDTERVLYEVFVRLYTLRNQLMHGGATWNSSVNRAQVRDGRALLARLLPVMLGVMMSNPVQFDGRPFYPVVKD